MKLDIVWYYINIYQQRAASRQHAYHWACESHYVPRCADGIRIHENCKSDLSKSLSCLVFLATFFPRSPKNIRRLSIWRRVSDEPLSDLPLPAPKRFKRSAPEPEEPPPVPEVPKAELSGTGAKSWAKSGKEIKTNERRWGILWSPAKSEIPPLTSLGFRWHMGRGKASFDNSKV